jgi:hypothetical protein
MANCEFQLIENDATFGVESEGIEKILNGNYMNHADSFEVGVSSLLLFMQQSFTGPALNLQDKKVDMKLLSVDGEDIYHLTPFSYLLLQAKNIFIDNGDDLSAFEVMSY